MAKGFKTGGRDFVKGKPGGPGRGHLSPEAKQFRKLTADEFIKRVNKYFFLTEQQILQLQKEKKTPDLLDLYIRNSILNGLKKGDYHTLDCMLNRIIGRPSEKVELTNPAGNPVMITSILARMKVKDIRDIFRDIVKEKEEDKK